MLVAIAFVLIRTLLGSNHYHRLAGRYESDTAHPPYSKTGMRGPKPLAELVIVQSPSLTVDDDAFRAKVEEVHAAIEEIGPETIAGGIGGTPIFHYTLAGSSKEATENVEHHSYRPGSRRSGRLSRAHRRRRQCSL